MIGNGKPKRPKVFVALPARPGENMALGLWQALQCLGKNCDIVGPRSLPSSMLPLSFNLLWCEALNARRQHGITHFCMVHSDVIPKDTGWLDMLVAEQQRVGADILASVIAIKDARGMTSTGIFDPRTREMTKLSLTDVHKLPTTFDAAGAGHPGKALLMNTGCWVCDFTQPWVEKMCFRFHDHIFQQDDGEWWAACVGEDWLFSIDAYRLGLKCFATRKLAIDHQGVYQYPNIVPWGKPAEQDASYAWNIEPPASWNWVQSPMIGTGVEVTQSGPTQRTL